MGSKLGIFVQVVTPEVKEFIKRSKPVVALSMHHDLNFWREVKEASPETFLIGRAYVHDQPLDDPVRNAKEFFEKHVIGFAERMRGIYNAWMSYNEVPVYNGLLPQFNEFECEFSRLMHREGFKTVVGNFGVGGPDIDSWPQFYDALREGDYLGLHEYGCCPMEDAATWLCLRHRRFYPRLPEDCKIPIFITETGIDNMAQCPHAAPGWKRAGITAEEYFNQLKWYDAQLQHDDYVLGACIFLMGGYEMWRPYDITGEVADRLAEYIAKGEVEDVEPVEPEDEDIHDTLVNGDFEGAFTQREAPEIVVAYGWHAWWNPDWRPEEGVEAGHGLRPEFKPDTERPPSGTCQKFFSTYGTHDAGLYQRIRVGKGAEVTFSAEAYVWSSSKDNLSKSEEDGLYRVAVGIDPYGGKDPLNDRVIWSGKPKSGAEYDGENETETNDRWTRLSVSATAKADVITVFLRGHAKWRVKHNDSYWDNCQLEVKAPEVYEVEVKVICPTKELRDLLSGCELEIKFKK